MQHYDSATAAPCAPFGRAPRRGPPHVGSVTVARVVYTGGLMRRMFQSSGFLLCVLISAAGAYNVLSDNADVEHLAQEIACGGTGARPADPSCHAQKTSMERTPLAQTFGFATSAKVSAPPGKREASVRCARAFIFAGDYTCELR